jgi:hypothetical protein
MAGSSALKMEAVYSSKTLGCLQPICRCNSKECTLEETVVFRDVCENLPVVNMC